MSKLVITPFRPLKDLFIEEILHIDPNPKRAADIAEDLLKIILEICNKDSRIKLLKLFMGLGEINAYSQPVS
jgi:hypothetical protein